VVTPHNNSTADITVDVAANVALDSAGNINAVAIQSVKTVDTLAPTAIITRDDVNPTNASSVVFSVDFSESVTNLDATDFTLDLSGVDANSIVTIGDAGDTDASTYTVKVDAVVGDGTLGLDLAGDTNITDLVGNAVNTTPTANQSYTLDHTTLNAPPGNDPVFTPIERAPETDSQTEEESQSQDDNLAEVEEAVVGAEEEVEEELLFAEPEIIELPEVLTANDLETDLLVEVTRDVSRDESRFNTHEGLKPKHIDLQHLEIRQFETKNLELIELKKFTPSDSFFEALDELGRDLEESIEGDIDKTALSASVTTLVVTTGIMSWILRAGSLLGGFLTVIPLWRHFDPLPVLAEDTEKKDRTRDDQEETDSDDVVEALFDRKPDTDD
jgi:hypothetical protein